MNTPAPDKMAAARAAKAHNLAAKRQQIEALREEQTRRLQEAAMIARESATAMDMEPSWSESSIDEPPIIQPLKRKRERQITSQPFVAIPPPTEHKRARVVEPNARPTPLPHEFTWTEHATNAIYSAAPIVGQCVLLFAGLMVTIAANTKVDTNKSNVYEPATTPQVAPDQNVWMPPPTPTRSVNEYSLL